MDQQRVFYGSCLRSKFEASFVFAIRVEAGIQWILLSF